MIRRFFAAGTIIVLLLVPGLQARSAGPEPVLIDVVLSLTGSSSFVGKTDQDALTTLQASVNGQNGVRGRPVHFVFHDDRSEPQTSIELLNGILQQHPAIFLGSNSFASCRAMAALVNSGPVEYCLSPAMHPPKGSYVFSSSASTADELRALIRYFRENGWSRIATLTAIDIGGQQMDSDLSALLQLPENKSRISVVDREHFNPADLTVMAQLSKIKSVQPQAVILWASGTPFTTEIRDANAIALDVPIGASNANMNYLQLKQYASFVPKNLFFPGPAFLAGQTPTKQAGIAQRQFFSAFSAVGKQPDFIDSTAWDPGLIAISALRTLGPTATSEQVRSYIANLSGFTGIAGVYDFRDGNQRGLSDKDIMITRWDPVKTAWIAVSRLGGAPLR